MRKLLFVLLFAAAQAVAQAAGPSATLTWVPPTTNTDTTPITLPLTFNVYQGPTGAEGATPVQTGLTGTSVTITAGLADGTTVCFKITAVEGGQESAKSNEACKTFPPATPNAPATLTVN